MPDGKDLLKKIRAARGEVGATVAERLREFEANDDYYHELCFCILTANYTAEGGMRIQEAAAKRGGFHGKSREELRALLREFGHRFPNVRSAYLHESQKHKRALEEKCAAGGEKEIRDWLVASVKGLGLKEASHFLRNVGFFNVAILDKHVLNVLAEHGLIEKPRSLTRKKYLEIEGTLEGLAKKLGMPLGELDLYLWYLKTGKVMK